MACPVCGVPCCCSVHAFRHAAMHSDNASKNDVCVCTSENEANASGVAHGCDTSVEQEETICRLPAQALPVASAYEPVMIIDTACHLNVTSDWWMSMHENTLSACGLPVVKIEARQTFKFGEGNPHVSKKRYVMPAGIRGNPLILRAFTLPQPIPFLSSRKCQRDLGMLLNGTTNTAMFFKLCGTKEIPLCLSANNHLAVRLTDFPRTDFPAELLDCLSDKEAITSE